MDSGGQAFLPQRSHNPGGQQEGPAPRRTHPPRARQDEAGVQLASVLSRAQPILTGQYLAFSDYWLNMWEVLF